MQLGIFAKTFPGSGPEPVLAASRAAGYDCVQFNMACAGLPSMPDAVDDAVIERIEAARAATGVTFAALSGTYNMIHPDPLVRAAGLRRIGVVIETARRLAIPLVTVCTGSRDAEDMWRHHPDNATPEAFADLLEEMTKVVALAEAAGVDIGVEPEQANVIVSADDALRLIDVIGSRRIRIVLDPANLFEKATTEEARAIVAAAIDRLAGHVAMAHGKDRATDGSFVAAGTGVVDFPDFIARLHAAGFDGPVVTHGLSVAEAPGVARYLRGLLSS